MSAVDPALVLGTPAPAVPSAASTGASSSSSSSTALSTSPGAGGFLPPVVGDTLGSRAIPTAVRLRQPVPVRISGVALVNEACLEFLHIEMVGQLWDGAQSDPAAAALKLERIGFRVGQKITEKQAMARPRFASDIDRIKFVCKEFWSAVFKRPQVDNLKTNNRGTYVLTDAKFRWLANISGPDTAALAPRYTHFPCGLIRGCLAALGLHCAVTAETQNLPVVTFRLEIRDPKEL